MLKGLNTDFDTSNLVKKTGYDKNISLNILTTQEFKNSRQYPNFL